MSDFFQEGSNSNPELFAAIMTYKRKWLAARFLEDEHNIRPRGKGHATTRRHPLLLKTRYLRED